jgi:UDP-3-O-[3-hydroxymyristoyl] glucosamine N-acyltransferase
MEEKSYTLGTLAKMFNLELHGDANRLVKNLAPLDKAGVDDISFLEQSSYRKYLATTPAAVVVKPEHAAEAKCSVLIASDPRVIYAKLSALFNRQPKIEMVVHPTAILGENCKIAANVSIGAYCVLGNNVTIAKNVVIGPGCTLADNVTIGADTLLHARVNIYYGVTIGERNIIHSGVVIGADGFGMANEKGVWHKVHQLGSVVIGNDVEIGANTTIDRGALENTVIEDDVKIDNQIQIAHNVRIGAHTAIAGCVGIAGSTKIGKHCLIGGGAGISGGLEIADGVIITAMAGVGKSITEPGVYAGAIPAMPHRSWWRIYNRLMQLEETVQRLFKVEKLCGEKNDDHKH